MAFLQRWTPRAYGEEVPPASPPRTGWIRRLTGACMRHRGVALGALTASVFGRQPRGGRPAAHPGRRRRRGGRLHRRARGGRGRDRSGWRSSGSARRSCAATWPAGSRSTSSTTCAGRCSPPCSGSTASGRTRCAPARWSPGRSPTCSWCSRCCRWCRSSLGVVVLVVASVAAMLWLSPLLDAGRAGHAARGRWSRCGRAGRCSRPRGRRSSGRPTSPSRWRRPSPASASSRASGRRPARSRRSNAGAGGLFAERMRAARMTARLNPTLLALPTLGPGRR